jgi:hypothetical protein
VQRCTPALPLGVTWKPWARLQNACTNIQPRTHYNGITVTIYIWYKLWSVHFKSAPYITMVYVLNKLWVGAKPRPNPPPFSTLNNVKYIKCHKPNKAHVETYWLAEVCQVFINGGGLGVEPRGLQYNFYI